jgi:hypothetical protein
LKTVGLKGLACSNHVYGVVYFCKVNIKL